MACGLLIILRLSNAPLSRAGTIHGHVLDDKKQPVIGAIVKVAGTKRGAYADVRGEYRIDGLPPGTYRVIASRLGYTPDSSEHVTISQESTVETLDITLVTAPLSGGDVVVQGRMDRETEASARLSERSAKNIINVVTAETITRSPEHTAADVLQRVSGLSLQSDQGEGRYVIFRGMEQRYNNTLLNGIEIPSPEPKDRFVPLDIIPSELLSRVEVTKALTPNMEGDAIGGTADLLLKSAGDEPLLALTIGSGYSQYLLNTDFTSFDHHVNDLDPAEVHGTGYAAQPNDFTRNNLTYTNARAMPDAYYSLTASNRYFDHLFGVLVSGSYQNTYRRTEGLYYSIENNINNIDSVSHVIVPTYGTQETREYSTDRERIGLYGKFDYIFDPDNTIDLGYSYVGLNDWEARHAVNAVINTQRGRAFYNITDRSAIEYQRISTLQLDGNHNLLPQLTLTWTGAYSDAYRDQPDKADLETNQNKDAEGNTIPTVIFFGIDRTWQHNDDHDLMGKADLTYALNDHTTLQAGTFIRDKHRVNYQNDYVLNADTGHTQVFTSIDSAAWTVYDNYGTPVYGYNNYTATEQVVSGYGMGTFTFGDLTALGGVRIEQTNQGYTTQAPISAGANSASINYTDILPSLHLRYALTEKQFLRFSATESISRPSYFELVPYQVTGEEFTETGNYQLRRTKATNFDVRYEYYPNLIEVLTAGIFYKKIIDPIELGFVGNNPASSVIQPQNLGNAVNAGFELVAGKHFGDFGVELNYTYTHSAISSTKIEYTRDSNADPVTHYLNETRPLVGQSDHILNATISFERPESGTFAEVTYGYTGRRLVLVSPFEGYDNYQNPASDLSCSFEQRVYHTLTFFGKLTNLLNTPYEVVLQNGQLFTRETYKASIELGLRYKM